MIKFSDMSKDTKLEDNDYFPIVDSSETDLNLKNKTVLYSELKKNVTKDIQSAEDKRVQAEKERQAAEQSRASAENSRKSAETSRVNAENARVKAETAREDKEKGYVAQAKKWATYSTDTNQQGSDINNAHYWADKAHDYADFIIPNFYIDFNTMELMMGKETDTNRIKFTLDANKNLLYELSM